MSVNNEQSLKALKAADAIIFDLSDRIGLRQEWEGIDDEIRAEIRSKWARLIYEAFQ